MKSCEHQPEVARAVRAGQWPHGCADDLRKHVADCAICADEVRLTAAFAVARASTQTPAALPSADLLWWKAQLRRKQQAMERLESPGMAISTAAMAAALVVLLAVMGAFWKRGEWTHLLAAVAPVGRGGWWIAALLCGFGVVAIMVGLGLTEERDA